MASHKRFSYESQCEGKRGYRDKRSAKSACRKAEQRFGRMSPYRCAWCQLWHVGHKPSKRNDNGDATVAEVERMVVFISSSYRNLDLIWNQVMTPRPPDVVAVIGPPAGQRAVDEALERPGRPNVTWHSHPSEVPPDVRDRLLVFINPGDSDDGNIWWDHAADWCREKVMTRYETEPG